MSLFLFWLIFGDLNAYRRLRFNIKKSGDFLIKKNYDFLDLKSWLFM